MAIIRRPNTNYIAGAGITIAKADNPSLDAVDVTITGSPKSELLAVWAGPLPTITGAGLEFTVPRYRGAVIVFPLARAFSRLSVLPVGSCSFRIERSVGGGLFVATAVVTLTHTTSDYEKTNTSLAGSVTSGDIVRLVFVAVNGSGGQYQVHLQGDEA